MKLTTLAAALCSCIVCFGGENLIQNPSFEQVVDGLPLKWKVSRNDKLQNVVHKAEEGGTDGKYCGTITSGDPGTAANHFVAWIQDFPPALVEKYLPEKEMSLTFDYKSNEPGTVIRAYVEGKTAEGWFNFFGPTIKPEGNWSKYQMKFKTPKSKPQLFYVVIQVMNKGSASFDNVQATEVVPEAK